MTKTPLQLAALIYLFCTAVYAVTAAGRLRAPSTDTHFVWMADAWLHRRLDLGRPPPHGNDWAEVDYLKLKDGTQVAGAFQRAVTGRFRTLTGKLRNIPDSEIASREKKYYVSFPPMPAVLMLPLVALFGFRTNDVLFNVVLAGAAPALVFLVLRRLRGLRATPGGAEAPDATGLASDLWLTGLFAFGSVFYFSSVQGQVWFTAHIVSQALVGLFVLCALGARRPVLAGLFLGALMLTRPHMVCVGLLLVFEALRRSTPDGRYPDGPRAALRGLLSGPVLKPLLGAAVPFLILSAAGFVLNYLRFKNPFEFGHSYITTMQADNIQRYGLLNYEYMPRNLAAAFTLLPKLLDKPPFVQISYHGVSLLLTTPVLLYLLWPRSPQTRGLRLLLWACVLPTALAGFMYQNDGYIQFGFRFSLDYMLLLTMLLALGSACAIPTWRFRALVLCGVAVNLFGAVTFGRMWQFYYNGFFPVS